MNTPRLLSTHAGDKRMIDAWAAQHLTMDDYALGEAGRLADATRMVRRALERQALGPDVPTPAGRIAQAAAESEVDGREAMPTR